MSPAWAAMSAMRGEAAEERDAVCGAPRMRGAVRHRRRETLHHMPRRDDGCRDGAAKVCHAQRVRAADMHFDRGEVRIVLLDAHGGPPCGKNPEVRPTLLHCTTDFYWRDGAINFAGAWRNFRAKKPHTARIASP